MWQKLMPALLTLLLVTSIFLVACGSGNDGTGASVSTSTPKRTPTNLPTIPPSKSGTKPSGTYLAWAGRLSLTFKDDTLETFNTLEGKHIFKYEISDDGTQITTTNLVTGEESTDNFKYVKELDVVYMWGLEYYHR